MKALPLALLDAPTTLTLRPALWALLALDRAAMAIVAVLTGERA